MSGNVGNLGPDLSPDRRPYSEEYRALREEVDAFLESGEQEREVTFKGSAVNLVRDPDAPGGVRITGEGMPEQMSSSTYSGDERPDDYPDDIPFVAGATAMVSRLGSPPRLFSVVWMPVPESQSSFDFVVNWHLEGGWAEIAEPEDFEARLSKIMATGRERMMQQGLSEEEAEQAVQRGIEALRSSRRTRVAKDGVTRGLSVMQIEGQPGVINLFQKNGEGDDPGPSDA